MVADLVLHDGNNLDQQYERFREKGQIGFVTFHPSMAYEDFVEGFRPDEDGKISLAKGIFKEMCLKALSAVMPDPSSRLKKVSGKYKGETFSALYDQVKRKIVIDDVEYAPSTAAADVIEKKFKNRPSINGHDWWKIDAGDSMEKSIKELSNDSDSEGTSLFDEYFKMNPWERKKLFEDLNEDQRFVLIIDEINRANISKVFGELITLIEENKRLGADEELSVTLPYSRSRFGIPKNLCIVGTMNTADSSIAHIDIALRRRFIFEEMPPRILDDGSDFSLEKWLADNTQLTNEFRTLLCKVLNKINLKIRENKDLGREKAIGHAFFMKKDMDEASVNLVWKRKIIPLLEEYYFFDQEQLGEMLRELAQGEFTSATVKGWFG